MATDRPDAEQAPTPTTSRPIAVVGIGVSNATRAALQSLFATMPSRTGAAFVIVSQSADGIRAAEIVATINAAMPDTARIATDLERLAPNGCYVAPDGMITTLVEGSLSITQPQQSRGHRGTIDTFLISLAEEQREAAVAILFAHLQDTGSIGLARLKECGGLSLAERAAGTAEGEWEGAAGLADAYLPLAEIPLRLSSHLEYLHTLSEGDEAAQIIENGESRLPLIATILRNRTGHDFHGYKPNTFLRRIQRRMHVVRVAEIDAYIERLRGDADEVQSLFQDLLIGVTQFFRDPSEFAILEREVFPSLLKREGDHQLRLWVLGCATGEEAYSIAILLREAMTQLDNPPHVQIFATDIDARALSIARTGRYPESIERDVSPERLQRWFIREGGTYCVHKDLREMCIFSAHNVIKDAPFSRIDLISCRNLLIYLKSDLQDRVIPLFHFSLRPGGYLFLGPSENVTRHNKLFAPVDRRHRIFRRQDTPTRVLPEFPLTATPEPRRNPGEATAPRAWTNGSLARRAERVVDRYAPAYVIVDADHEVRNFSGRTGPFLDPSSGVANLNLLNLVHRDLRLDLRAALHKVGAEQRPVRVPNLRIGDNGEQRRVTLAVEPIIDEAQDSIHFVVLFQDQGVEGSAEGEAARDPALLRDEHVQRLEGELRVTKDRLQATIEELESTNEELKSSNEEYQSINEELQSANEELETSKEELQSVNEELQTVNGELAHRVTELAHANSDLKNLLESTQIATLFLDNDLRVKSFTPSMSEVFHLIDSDFGRPITHIAMRVPYPELQEDVRRVLRTLSTIERQIGGNEGPRYLVRVLPYRSVDNFIAGAVLTFLDISETTRAQAALRAAEKRARLATTAARIVTWELDAATRRFAHVDQFEPVLGMPPPASLDALLAALHEEDRTHVGLAFEHALSGADKLNAEGRVTLAKRELWLRFSGAGGEGTLLGVFQDVTDRHQAAAQQSLLMAELQHRVKNILAVVRSITRRTLEGATNLTDFESDYLGRIDALARTQGLLANRGVEGVLLADLLADELSSQAHAEQASCEGPAILLKDNAAQAFALALHELATNAVKYGALSTPGGRLTVRWRIVNAPSGERVALEWVETGVEIPNPPQHSGFGRTLIERGLPYDLGAATSLEFTTSGVRCLVELPLSSRVIALPN